MSAVLEAESLKNLVERGLSLNASDIHLHSGYPPLMRICGSIVPMGDERMQDQQLRPQLLDLLSDLEKTTTGSSAWQYFPGTPRNQCQF